METVTILDSDSDLDSICRLCLASDKNLCKIFENDTEPSEWTVADKVLDTISLQIHEEDGLPSLICSVCRTLLDAFHNFKRKCITSDQTLRDYLQNMDTNFEVTKRNISCQRSQFSSLEILKNSTPMKMSCMINAAAAKIFNLLNVLIYVKSESDENLTEDLDKSEETSDNVVTIEPSNCSSSPDSPWSCEAVDVEVKVEITEPHPEKTKARRKRKYRRKVDNNVLIQTLFPCSQCDKKFFHKNSLTRHEFVHSDEKFECMYCKKTLSTRETLLRHVKAHIGQKAYTCDTCGKQYTSNTSFLAHVRKHTGERPYSCGDCNDSFSLPSSLARHIAKEHVKEKSFACDLCGAAFWVYDDLRSHVNRVH